MIINEIFLENAFTIAVAVAVANVAALVDTAGAANNLPDWGRASRPDNCPR